MTQQQQIEIALESGQKHYTDVATETNILQPNVRRILGQGVKSGIFSRVAKGVYTLVTDKGETRAYIEVGRSEEILPRMAAEGKKFDMVFLDPAYFSRALIGGNRGIKDYSFIMPDEFATTMHAVYEMMQSEQSHVYLMLSGAPSAQKDMQRYIEAASAPGFKIVGEGRYKKTFADGRPVTNVRGIEAAAERLLLLTKSGHCRQGELPDIQLDFTFERPPIKTSYCTQKAAGLLKRLILQSTHKSEHLLDPGAGSGELGEVGLTYGRIVTMVEALQKTAENWIVPKIYNYILWN